MIQPALVEFADLDEGLLAELRQNAARVQYLSGDFRAALAINETVMEVAEKRGLIWVLTQALIGRGNCLWSMGAGARHSARPTWHWSWRSNTA